MKTISFRVTDQEARVISDRASAERVTISEYVRRTAIAPQGAKPKRVRCPHTGALIFSGIKNEPLLTTEKVREMLADFP